ncbi:MAG: plastocyanin/azurin family copper-binding protein [Nitrososphaerales archaeon]
MSISRAIFILAVILTPAYAVGSSVNAQTNTADVQIAEGAADVENSKFYVPARITIPVGTTVVWTNLDDAAHTVTDGTATSPQWGTVFDSGIMRLGTVYKFTFDEVGGFPYLCVLHPWMIGKVTVLPQGASLETKISVKTDSATYKLGDNVDLTGIVSPVAGDESVLIEVLNPNELQLLTDNVMARDDGTFGYSFKLSGDLVVIGSYKVTVSYSGISTESIFVVEELEVGRDTGSAEVRVAAKQIRDFFLIRVRNVIDSGASVYGISFEVPDHVITAFRSPRDWSEPEIISSEVRSTTFGEPVGPKGKAYFKLKVDADQVSIIHWIVYDSSESILDQGDTKPISRRR